MRRRILFGIASLLGFGGLSSAQERDSSSFVVNIPEMRKTCSACDRPLVTKDGKSSMVGLVLTVPAEPILRDLYPELKDGSYEICPVCLLRALGVKL